MKIAITGGAGFIGHHLTSRLLHKGHEVTILDNLHRSTFERPQLRGARCIEGDVRDRDGCLHAFTGVETVIHLAAQSNVMGSEQDRDYTFSTNVVGTWNVAQAAEAAGVRHLVFASSREVYGDADCLPVRESAPLRPRNTYGASKVAAEAVLTGLAPNAPAVSTIRLGNVIGSGDSGRVIPIWLEQARAGRPLTVFGGSQLLDLVPVDFVCGVIARIVDRGPLVGPLNVASGRGTPILSLARRIINLTGSGSSVDIVPSRAPEVSRFCADVTRLRCELGMDPPNHPLLSIEATW